MSNYDEIENERDRFIAVYQNKMNCKVHGVRPSRCFKDDKTSEAFNVWRRAKYDASIMRGDYFAPLKADTTLPPLKDGDKI